MYAIVEIAGQQFKVTKGQEIFVNRLHEDEGSKVSFDRVFRRKWVPRRLLAPALKPR